MLHFLKNNLIGLVIVLLLLSFLPTNSVSAQGDWWKTIETAFFCAPGPLSAVFAPKCVGLIAGPAIQGINESVANAAGDAIIGPFAQLAGALRSLALAVFLVVVKLFDWITDFTLHSIPLTQCPEGAVGKCVVDYGWEAARNLANMFFVVMLVVIAFGTILRKQDYGLKLLPPLILVALLINFSRVFVGIFVDISQLIIRFFLQVYTGEEIKSLGMFLWDKMQAGEMFGSEKFLESANMASLGFSKGGGALFNNIMAIVFIGFTTAVFAILAFLFFIRIVALWILTIFSPLAFAALILPQTRSWWNKWFSNLIQWCFIGVGGAIGLFFATVAAKTTKHMLPQSSWAENAPSGLANFFQPVNILQYAVIMIFLILAVVLSLKTGAEGANIAMKWTQKAGRWAKKGAMGAGGWMARRRFVQERAGKAAGVAGRGLGKAAERVGRVPVVGGLGKAAISPTVAPLLGYAARTRSTEEAKKQAGSLKNAQERMALYHTSSPLQKLGILQSMAEKGELGKAMAENASFRSEALKTFDLAAGEGKLKDLLKAAPLEATPELLKKAGIELKAGENAIGTAFRWNKLSDIPDLDSSVFENPAIKSTLMTMSPKYLDKLEETHGRNTIEQIMRGEGGIDGKEPEELYKINPGLTRYLATSAGAAMLNWKGRHKIETMRDGWKGFEEEQRQRQNREEKESKHKREFEEEIIEQEKATKAQAEIEKELSRGGELASLERELSRFETKVGATEGEQIGINKRRAAIQERIKQLRKTM